MGFPPIRWKAQPLASKILLMGELFLKATQQNGDVEGGVGSVEEKKIAFVTAKWWRCVNSNGTDREKQGNAGA